VEHFFVGGYSQDARFNFPVGLTLDLEGSVLVIDTCNHALRKVLSKGQVTTVLGSPHTSEKYTRYTVVSSWSL